MAIPRFNFYLATTLTAVGVVVASLTSCGQTEDPNLAALKEENAAEQAELDNLKRDVGEARVQTGPTGNAPVGSDVSKTAVKGGAGESTPRDKKKPAKSHTNTRSE